MSQQQGKQQQQHWLPLDLEYRGGGKKITLKGWWYLSRNLVEYETGVGHKNIPEWTHARARTHTSLTRP